MPGPCPPPAQPFLGFENPDQPGPLLLAAAGDEQGAGLLRAPAARGGDCAGGAGGGGAVRCSSLVPGVRAGRAAHARTHPVLLFALVCWALPRPGLSLAGRLSFLAQGSVFGWDKQASVGQLTCLRWVACRCSPAPVWQLAVAPKCGCSEDSGGKGGSPQAMCCAAGCKGRNKMEQSKVGRAGHSRDPRSIDPAARLKD